MTQQKKSILPWVVVGGMSLFVLFILHFLVRSMGHEVNLVGEDYYDKAQQYDAQMTSKKNTNDVADRMALEFNQAKGIVELVVPEEFDSFTGKLKFYRPSDFKMDFELQVTENQKKFDVSHTGKGLWQLQLTLQSGEKTYFKEKQIIID